MQLTELPPGWGDRSMTMFVILKSQGNSDMQQDARRSLPGVPHEEVYVDDYAEASRVCLEYISTHSLGSGNWCGGKVYSAGTLAAVVSYNGKVWPPGVYSPEQEPLYVP